RRVLASRAAGDARRDDDRAHRDEDEPHPWPSSGAPYHGERSLREPPRVPAPFERHVFVCQNERTPDDPRGCCAAKGSAAVLEAFKSALKARDLSRRIRAQKAGCLDACATGVSVVVYPE